MVIYKTMFSGAFIVACISFRGVYDVASWLVDNVSE